MGLGLKSHDLAKCEAKLEFPGEKGGAELKTFCLGSMSIFWNCTLFKRVICFFFLFFFSTLGNSQGLAAVPNREEDFKQCLELSIKYAEALHCTR